MWRQLALFSCLLPTMVASLVAQPLPEQRTLPEGLQTVRFHSEAIGRESKYDIVLPPGYEKGNEEYPVVYLLHGYMQNYTVWGRNLGAAELARELGDLILVMPDAGNSWYLNYASSEESSPNQWEDFIVGDLVGHVDSNFRTISEREGRAIAGLSMGGYASVLYGLKYPGHFLSVASSSGALGFARERAAALAADEPPRRQRPAEVPPAMREADSAVAAIIDIPGFSRQGERTPPGILFETEEQARANDPFQLLYTVPKSQLPHFYLDAGTEDSLSAVTREFAQILMFNAVPVDFMQAEGGHDATWWRLSLQRFLPVQHALLHSALRAQNDAEVD